MSELRFVSLFSGCGGLDLGLKQAGFKPVFALDNDVWSARSHEANFPGVPFFRGSVADVDRDKAAELSGGETMRDIDLLAGGPPCPPFSKSRFYRKEKPRGMADPLGEITLDGYVAFV